MPPRIRPGAVLVCLFLTIATGRVAHADASTPGYWGPAQPVGTLLVPGDQWAGPAAALGDLNVYSNGSSFSGPYQCAELVGRWARIAFGEPGYGAGGAGWWTSGPTMPVPWIQHPNGGADGPRFGDILVFAPSSTFTSGHVAVVSGTGSGYVNVVEQNASHNGRMSFPINGTTMPIEYGMSILGWLRAAGPMLSSAAQSWTTYANGNLRTGNDSADSNISPSSVRHAWDSATMNGAVDAQPLVFGGHVIAATENNTVYALDSATGATVWSVGLGAPLAPPSWLCGGSNPVGIAGTPVIDPTTGNIYVLAELSSPSVHYQLFAIDQSGNILWNTEIAPPGFDPYYQSQLGALALSDGNVVMVFGGRSGNCGNYSGYVMTFRESGLGRLDYWAVDNDFSHVNGAGISARSGAAVDGPGNIYVATGVGTNSASSYDGSESVLKLSPGLALLDHWSPGNWQTLNASSTELGPAPEFVASQMLFVAGKSGDGYLLNSSHLGQGGGQLFTAHVCPGLNANAVFGGTAFDGTRIYVPCDNGLVALSLNTATPSFTQVWQAAETHAGPPTFADGLVWDEDYGSKTLNAYDPTSGSKVFSFALGASTDFGAPSAAGGQIYVAAGNHIAAFAGTVAPATSSPCNYFSSAGSAYAGATDPLEHPDGTIVTIGGNLYWIQNWTLCPIGSMEVFASFNLNANDIKPGTAADGTLNLSRSVYFENGTLIKGQSGPNVYVIHQTGPASWEKRLITSIDFFTGLGYSSADVINVPDSALGAPDGPPIGSTTQHPDGTVVRDASTGNIFLLEGGLKEYIGSMPAYTSWRISTQQTKTATQTDLAIPGGPNLQYRDGAVVKGSGPNIYVVHLTVSGAEKRLISSGQTFAALGYTSADVITVPDQELPAANGPSI